MQQETQCEARRHGWHLAAGIEKPRGMWGNGAAWGHAPREKGAGPTAAVEWGLSQLTNPTGDRHGIVQRHRCGRRMTALIVLKLPQQALIVTDTLSCGMRDQPAAFTSKALILPHLHMVIAAQGVAGIAEKWFDTLRSSQYQKFADVQRVTPSHLREIWAGFVAKHGLGVEHTVDVFQAGLDVDDVGADPIRIIHYPSAVDFRGIELSTPAFYPEIIGGPPKAATRDEALIAFAMALQRDYAAAGKPYAVGGRLHLVAVSPRFIATNCLHTFDGIEDVGALIAQREEQLAKASQRSPRRSLLDVIFGRRR